MQDIMVNGCSPDYCVGIGSSGLSLLKMVDQSMTFITSAFVQDLMRAQSVKGYHTIVRRIQKLIKSNPPLKIPFETAIKDQVVQQLRSELPEESESDADIDDRNWVRGDEDAVVFECKPKYIQKHAVYELGEEEEETHFLYQNCHGSKNNTTWKEKSATFTCDKTSFYKIYNHPTQNLGVIVYTNNSVIHVQKFDMPLAKKFAYEPVQLDKIDLDQRICGITLNADASQCAVILSSEIILYDFVQKKAKTLSFTHEKYQGIVQCAAFADKGNSLVVGTGIGQFYEIDLTKEELISTCDFPNITPIFHIQKCGEKILAQTLFEVMILTEGKYRKLLKTDRILASTLTDKYFYTLTYDGIVSGYPFTDEFKELQIPCNSLPFECVFPCPYYQGLNVLQNGRVKIVYPDSVIRTLDKTTVQ